MSKVLITRPEFDYPTRYISAWAKKIVELVNKKGNALDLPREKSNRKLVESMLKKHNPSLVFFNGHGGKDCVMGQDNEVLVKAGQNEAMLTDKIVYSLSCGSAAILGPASVNSGARAYIGYKRDFALMYDENKRTRCHEDKLAELFLGPSNQVMVSLLKGHTVHEAHISAKNSFKKNIRKLLTSTSSPHSVCVPYLLWDLQAFIVVGDSAAKYN